MRNFLAILILVFGVFVAGASAQAPSILTGEVTAINQSGSQLTLKTKDGEMVVVYNEKTEFKRVSPDKPTDLSAAVASNQSEIGAGDKIVAVVELSEDKKSVKNTRRVFLLTKGDIAKKSEADQAKWQTRGIIGKVTAVNLTTNEVTVTLRGGMGVERTMIVVANDKTSYRRYAPNSVKYSDAKASSFGEIKVGDQLRALGEKSADNARITADEVVFGSFRMVAGKITAIDAAKGEITIKDVQTDKPVVIAVKNDTLLRRFPAEMAQRMAQMQAMRASGQMPQGAGRPASGQTPPQGTGSRSGMGQGGGGMMRGGGGDVDQMLERMPVLTLAELKVGDAIAASSSASSAPDRVTAIKFVAGIEPFLNVPQMPAQQGRPQQSPQINIPGLDGIGTP